MGDEAASNTGTPGAEVARELDLVGRRREFKIAGVRVAGRRRRPSGGAAPLPRELRTAGHLWLLSGIGMIIVWFTLFAVPSSTEWWTVQDLKVLTWFVDARTDAWTAVAKAFNLLTSGVLVRVLRIGTLLALIFFKRWRHFFAVLLAVLIVEGTGFAIQETVGRPRPLVPILVDWQGPSHPSLPIGRLGITLGVMAYALLPTGRLR